MPTIFWFKIVHYLVTNVGDGAPVYYGNQV